MFEEEKCPTCGNADYEIEDYGEEFDYDSACQWWKCICSQCGQHFMIERFYDLKSVEVSTD